MDDDELLFVSVMATVLVVGIMYYVTRANLKHLQTTQAALMDMKGLTQQDTKIQQLISISRDINANDKAIMDFQDRIAGLFLDADKHLHLVLEDARKRMFEFIQSYKLDGQLERAHKDVMDKAATVETMIQSIIINFAARLIRNATHNDDKIRGQFDKTDPIIRNAINTMVEDHKQNVLSLMNLSKTELLKRIRERQAFLEVVLIPRLVKSELRMNHLDSLYSATNSGFIQQEKQWQNFMEALGGPDYKQMVMIINTMFGNKTNNVSKISIGGDPQNITGHLEVVGGKATALRVTGHDATLQFTRPDGSCRLKNVNAGLTSDCTLQSDTMHLLPVGSIVMWTDSQNIPAGWAICDGTTHQTAKGPLQTPDLRGRFVLSVGGRTLDAVGGSEKETLGLTQIPRHAHAASAAESGNHAHAMDSTDQERHSHRLRDWYYASRRQGWNGDWGAIHESSDVCQNGRNWGKCRYRGVWWSPWRGWMHVYSINGLIQRMKPEWYQYQSGTQDCNPYKCQEHDCQPHDCRCWWSCWSWRHCGTRCHTCYNKCYNTCYEKCPVYSWAVRQVNDTTEVNGTYPRTRATETAGSTAADHNHGLGHSGAHAHAARSDHVGNNAAHENMPPFYVLCYIMRV